MKRVCILYLLILLCLRNVQAQSLINQPAPPLDFEAILQGGENDGIEQLIGKYVVLEFWATWCTPCVRSIPHLNELSQRFKDKNVQFVSVTDEPKEKIEAFLSKRTVEGWVAIDNGKNTHNNYGVNGLPQTFIINTNGVIIYHGGPTGLTEELLDAIVSGTYKPIVQEPLATTGKFGGWGGGQDPVITGNFDMDSMNYVHHEFIRKSVYPYPGSGWRQGNGEVGITILGMNINEIVSVICDLPSAARVLNRSKNDTSDKWDILFARKAGYDLEKGMAEIEGILSSTFSISLKDETIERDVWVPDYSKAKGLIPVDKVAEDDPNLKTYQLLTDICETTEKKIGQVVAYPEAARQYYVDVFDLGTNYYRMNGADLKKWLEDNQGISFRKEFRSLKVKVIYDK